MRNNMINIVLSLLFFLMSSCGDGFEEDDLLYLHVVNNSETPICVFIYTMEGDVESDYPYSSALKSESSAKWIICKKDYNFNENSGFKVIVIRLYDYEHFDSAKHDKPTIEDRHKTDAIVMYYSIEELRAMDWTIVYDGNME